ncbi:hypothetical protein PRUPE_3G144700 [Prunus persica]|uniref:Uncharacterized protein n=1 Tax=Prunus persica TaxID=3760 RepID=A0A251Q0E8_PRUPE|nr:hypothetical protein PRUPE_3G144700 [Prunus persica]
MFTAQLQAQTHHPRPALQVAGGTGKSHSKGLNAKHSANQDSIVPIENSTNFNFESHQKESSSFVQQEGMATYHAPQKRQKLHWGLDTKERWERKANM